MARMLPLVGALAAVLLGMPAALSAQAASGGVCTLRYDEPEPDWVRRPPRLGPFRNEAIGSADSSSVQSACAGAYDAAVRKLCYSVGLLVANEPYSRGGGMYMNCVGPGRQRDVPLPDFREDGVWVRVRPASPTRYEAHVLVSARREQAPSKLGLLASSAVLPGYGSFRRGEPKRGWAVAAGIAGSAALALVASRQEDLHRTRSKQAIDVVDQDRLDNLARSWGTARKIGIGSGVLTYVLGLYQAGRSSY